MEFIAGVQFFAKPERPAADFPLVVREREPELQLDGELALQRERELRLRAETLRRAEHSNLPRSALLGDELLVVSHRLLQRVQTGTARQSAAVA